MVVNTPMFHYLLGARGLPVYFLLVVVVVGGVPIITVSTIASNPASESEMLTFSRW